MTGFDAQLAQQVDAYIESLFVPEDPILAANIANADASGLPSINVSPNLGKFMYLITRITGARRVLEIGTLGGYSTTWLGRALPADGHLITLEFSPVHAEVARRNLAAAELNGLVDLRVGDASASLQAMVDSGEPPFDLIFIDADKPAYVKYLDLCMRLSRPGTVILADNVIRNGGVMEEDPKDSSASGAKAYNEAIAANPLLESIALPIFREQLDGIAISLVK